MKFLINRLICHVCTMMTSLNDLPGSKTLGSFPLVVEVKPHFGVRKTFILEHELKSHIE